MSIFIYIIGHRRNLWREIPTGEKMTETTGEEVIDLLTSKILLGMPFSFPASLPQNFFEGSWSVIYSPVVVVALYWCYCFILSID